MMRRCAPIALALLAACSSGGDGGERVVSGVARVPGVRSDETVTVYAQALTGATLGSVAVNPDGTYSLSFVAPPDASEVLLAAVVSGDSERRALAAVDLRSTVPATPALRVAALDEDPAAPIVILETGVDAKTTAAVVLRTAAGRMDLPPAAFDSRHAAAIDTLAQAIDAAALPTCSVGASWSPHDTADVLGRTVMSVASIEGPREDGGPSTLRDVRAAMARDLDLETRLRRAQEIISYNIYSTNNPRIVVDTAIGLMPLFLVRTAIWAMTGEPAVEFLDGRITGGDLERLATISASLRWGNCREKAYLGAYAATFAPEVRQLVVVGLEVQGVGAHAVAIACIDGSEVYDLTAIGGTFVAPPVAARGRCFVIDPWAPPIDDLRPGLGHVALWDADYAQRYGWELIDVVKPVDLAGAARSASPIAADADPALLGSKRMTVCATGADGVSLCEAPEQPTPVCEVAGSFGGAWGDGGVGTALVMMFAFGADAPRVLVQVDRREFVAERGISTASVSFYRATLEPGARYTASVTGATCTGADCVTIVAVCEEGAMPVTLTNGEVTVDVGPACGALTLTATAQCPSGAVTGTFQGTR